MVITTVKSLVRLSFVMLCALNDRFFFRNFFMSILFNLRVFARNLRGNPRRNTFCILFWCLAWGSNPGFTYNKPTYYRLDYGDFKFRYSWLQNLNRKYKIRDDFLKVNYLVKGLTLRLIKSDKNHHSYYLNSITVVLYKWTFCSKCAHLIFAWQPGVGQYLCFL